MKKLILAVFCCTTLQAATAKTTRYGQQSCPKMYIGLSTGIDNPSGIIGINFDVPVTSRFSLGTGAGLSLWGYKAYGEGRLYFKDCNRGWALGAGVTYSTGLQDVPTEAPTTVGTTEVMMDLLPTTTAIFSGYRFFSLGERHRMHLQLGWSQRFEARPYTVTSPHVLTSDGDAAMSMLAPGGLMVGFGFSFGIGGR